MTVMDIDLIKERIKAAEPESPIAVFKCGVKGRLNAVFSNTVEAQRWIKNSVYPLVGIYHNRMDVDQICRFLGCISSTEYGE